MAPKTNEFSLDIRKHITELHKEGKSFREIGNILKLSFTTVGYIVKKYLETGSVENKPRPVVPSKLTSRAKRMTVRSATNKPMTSAQNITNELLSLSLSQSSCNVVAAVAEWYRYRTVACFVTGSSPVPLKTRRVGQRCTLNLSRVEMSSHWCGSSERGCQLRCRPRHLTMVQNYVVHRQKPSCS
ncbi:uncharacterized protein TNCV_3283641 [Trichonephila clavipes]|nr:uncharacterized protein TNCV_3283641 [Trichonephila clavipes]